MVGNKMIGLAFSSLGGAQNISYIIPCAEIETCLADVADARYDGKPVLPDRLQTLENADLRSFLKLPPGTEGIVVDEPVKGPESGGLRKWDVITKIATSPVDDQGMIKLGANNRVGFQYLVQSVTKDGKVPLSVVRDSKPVQLEVPVNAAQSALIPNLDGHYPSYFVYGPLAFSTASMELLRDQTAEFVTFEFEGAFTETLVFPNKEMAATEAILTDNGVRSQGSPDTLAVWNLKSTR